MVKAKPSSLTLRLIISASIISILALLSVGLVLAAIFKNSVSQNFDRQLSVYVDALTANIDTNYGHLAITKTLADPRFSKPLSGYYWQISQIKNSQQTFEGQKSRSLFDENLLAPNNLLHNALIESGETQSMNIIRGNENLRLAARVISFPTINEPILLLVAADISEIKAATNSFNRILAASLVSLAIGLVGAIYFQVKIGLAPLNKMSAQLFAIRQGDMDKLDENIPPEIAPIAKELNALLIHNQEVVERARTHVGNLAHALKTPISVLMNEAKTNKTQFGLLVEGQAETMTRQVGHYLKRAQAAARAETLRARTEIQIVVDDLVRTLSRLYKHEGVRIDIMNKTNKFFRGDREDLEDLIGNLTENACKYGGGLVEITFIEEGDFINIIIEDDGEGLSNEEAMKAIRRGVRLDETSHGSGLGLSIADELARAYGGKLSLDRSELGGLKVNLHLPVANT